MSLGGQFTVSSDMLQRSPLRRAGCGRIRALVSTRVSSLQRSPLRRAGCGAGDVRREAQPLAASTKPAPKSGMWHQVVLAQLQLEIASTKPAPKSGMWRATPSSVGVLSPRFNEARSEERDVAGSAAIRGPHGLRLQRSPLRRAGCGRGQKGRGRGVQSFNEARSEERDVAPILRA